MTSHLASYDSSIFTTGAANGTDRRNRKRKLSESESDYEEQPAKKHISPEVLLSKLESIQEWDQNCLNCKCCSKKWGQRRWNI